MEIKKLAIYLFYGKKGSGKSLESAKLALRLFSEYRKSERNFPMLPARILFANQKFNNEIEKQEIGIHLFYWDSAKQLRYCPRVGCWKSTDKHPVHDADILHDEIGKDLPAGSWADTPKWFKQVFSHLRKRGNRYFANTQVFEDIDIAFRRQIDFAFEIRKLFGSPDITATRPKPKFTWGLIIIKPFDPRILEWERDPLVRESKQEKIGYVGLPSFTWIGNKYVKAYDTTDEIPPFRADQLEHVEFWCENPNCEKHGKNMLDEGAKPRLEHYKI